MVKLNKIYTKTGDDGSTGLGTGMRVAKTAPRVVACGDVDEANAAIGMARSICTQPGSNANAGQIGKVLGSVQQDLFDVGADLCTPLEPNEEPGSKLRMVASQVDRLEGLIDEFNADLPTLTSFVLPGGSPLSVSLHMARTVVRRAERQVVALLETDAASVNNEALRYLNRLSDLLFVLARVANDAGRADVLWDSNRNREAGS